MPKAKTPNTDPQVDYPESAYQPLPNEEAIVAFNGKALLTSESYLDVKAYQHALAFTVAGLMDEDLLKETRDAIKSALENGTDFRTFKQRLKPYLMSKGWLAETLEDGTQTLTVGSNRRLRTIYSTNLQSAYSAGQWSRIQQTKEFLPYLQYMKSVSENPRLSHKRYYGLCRPADDPIWQYIFAPNGWGCKCWMKQLTRRQAEKVGISEDKPLETEEYVNPKTGEKSQIPMGIDPSFAHNHDHFTALLKLAEDKHGKLFAEKLRIDVENMILERAIANSAVTVANFTGINVLQSEVERLLHDPANGDELIGEAMTGAEYQEYFGVRLERPKPEFNENGTPKAGFDYWITDTGERLDFLFALYGEKPFKVGKYNEYFAVDDNWLDKIKTIQDHFAKADVVPMDLRYITLLENRIKLINYVLSLPKEQQEKVVLIWGDKQP